LKSLAPGNQRTTNTWDGENRLTQVALPSGIRNTFSYNRDGQRVQKQDSGGTTKHVWDWPNIVLETDGSNNVVVVYTLNPVVLGNLVLQRRSGITSFYLFDALGSSTQLASSLGSVTDSYLYDSFGNTLLSSGTTANPFRFLVRYGYYYDADLLGYQSRARYYNPQSGRWLTRLDYLGFRGNLYVYFSINPLLRSSSIPADPAALTTKGCTDGEAACVQQAVRIAVDALQTKNCFSDLLKGHKNCEAEQLTRCLLNVMNSMVISCVNLNNDETKPCGIGQTTAGFYYPYASNQDLYCIPLKSSPGRCSPCQLPIGFAFADDCSLCDGTQSVPVALCRTPDPGTFQPWPRNKELPLNTQIDQTYCSSDPNKTKVRTLAGLLVHEAAHSCVGKHLPDPEPAFDNCGRPNPTVIEQAFRKCVGLPPRKT
jgi:RHS repeat-associated protein